MRTAGERDCASRGDGRRRGKKVKMCGGGFFNFQKTKNHKNHKKIFAKSDSRRTALPHLSSSLPPVIPMEAAMEWRSPEAKARSASLSASASASNNNNNNNDASAMELLHSASQRRSSGGLLLAARPPSQSGGYGSTVLVDVANSEPMLDDPFSDVGVAGATVVGKGSNASRDRTLRKVGYIRKTS